MEKVKIQIPLLAASLTAMCCVASPVTENLRGFGRVDASRETVDLDGSGRVAVWSFRCETPENAETVAGKFLHDLYADGAVTFKDGIHETRSGAAFAVGRAGLTTVIRGAEDRKALEAFLSRNGRDALVGKAAVPEWMKAFGWGVYGVGGLEDYHGWMARARSAARDGDQAADQPLDPREDFAFLREMGPIHFDNWLQEEGFDNSDGILSPLIYSRRKLAEDYGVPFGVRLYLPAGDTSSYFWFTRRFAGRMDRPAPWMQNGWIRYHNHLPHASWYDEDIWGYTAAHAKKAMRRLDTTGKVRTWMHPAGELVHQPWYDWHADYSPAASNSWHAYLRGKGVTLKTAAAMFNRPDRPFASWRDVPVPEFAHFAGLSGMVLDLYGTWQTKGAGDSKPTDAESAWRELPDFPGNRDFLSLYGGESAALNVKYTAERRFRRVFEWHGEAVAESVKAGGRVYLYFFPMADTGGMQVRHDVSLNGAPAVSVGRWCALDVTDRLKEGGNVLEILLRGIFWNGRVFLSTEKPAVYPNMAQDRCRLWTMWHDWRRDTKAERCETVFDAMRQADPDAPIEFMAPMHFGQPVANRLLRDWGAFAQFTGEGVWFFPWYKRYAKLYGYEGTSELAGPCDDVAGARRSALRVFLAGLDMHKPVFLAQTYSRDPALRRWWLSHKALFARMGTYDIDLKQPQVLIYRRTALTGDAFPEPFPAVDATVEKIHSPWNYDLGRGELQSIGQSYLYIDDDGIEDGKMDGFKVMVDCGNEIISESHVSRIRSWVEKGGVFIAYPFTGKSTPLKAGVWPMAALTGSKIGENAVRPGYVPKVSVPSGSRYFPSFAGQTIYGAKKRVYQLDFALDVVAPDTEPVLSWDDGRVAATARRVGKGLVIHLGSMFWRGSEDSKGMWNPSDEVERKFLRDLFAACGQPKALVETDDRLVLAQPYRSKNGLDLVAVLCNFNEEGDGFNTEAQRHRVTEVKLRTRKKPRRIIGYAGNPVNPVNPVEKELPFDWDEAAGVATVKVALPPQEVAVLNVSCHDVGGALEHWWAESKVQWRELKKPTRDFSKYSEGKWKDPTQDLKEGWTILTSSPLSVPRSPLPLDCLQFWGWPEGKGALCRKTFDLDDAAWLKGGGVVRFVTGAWVGPHFLSPATITLNGKVLAEKTLSGYIDLDVTALLREKGNELSVEFADSPQGGRFTGMNGCVYLYRRENPLASVDLLKSEGKTAIVRGADGRDAVELYVPRKWQGKYRVRLYMEGARDVPRGVRVRDRFMRRHHHNFGNITDIDITGLLRFGEKNRINIGANSPAENPDRTSIEPLTVLRLDLYRDR